MSEGEGSYQPTATTSPQSNRRFRVPSNPWIPYIGDCKALENFLNSKEGIAWLIPKYLNALLRGVSQVCFANNPLAGLVILIALYWSNVWVGLAGTVGATTAILTALLMRQDPTAISAGLTTYNAVLVGTVTASLWTPLYGEVLGVKIWIFIIIGSALSVFVTSATANILGSMKVPLPAITLPFNLVILLLFVSLMPSDLGSGSDPIPLRLQQSPPGNNHNLINDLAKGNEEGKGHSRHVRMAEDMSNKPTTDFNATDQVILDWGLILKGIILSSGQVYGVNDLISSVLIYIGIFIYSPILFMMSGFGAILATICGILFASAPYTTIYDGIWGYNGFLSASSVGGFFIVLTCHSFWNATCNVIFTVLVQQTLVVAFGPTHLPVFTLPFVISTLLFLSVTTKGNQMPRVDTITFPEMHRYNYRETRRLKNGQKKRESLVADEIAEEKELVLTDVKVVGEEEVEVDVERDEGEKEEEA